MKQLCLFLFIFVFGFTLEANAFRVSPMIYDLDPSGPGASKTIRILNTTNEQLPVEIFASKRLIDKDGGETRKDAEDDFLIFPPQAIIPAGATQAVRVQYIGDPAMSKSVGYVITVAQLPVDVENQEESGVSFSFRFGTSVNVVPKGAKPNVKVVEVTRSEEGAIVIVENTGNSYTRLSGGEWFLSNSQGKTYILKGDDLKAAVPQPLIQPETIREIKLPLPDDWDNSAIQAEFRPYS